MSQEKRVITVNGVLECLDKGMSRSQIKQHFGIQTWELKALFQHPKLKGRKAKVEKVLSFEVVDDTINEDGQSLTEAPATKTPKVSKASKELEIAG
jgi:hypothetical protein